MTKIRKEVLIRVGYIGLGVLIGIPFVNSLGPERWIALFAFLFSVIQFIQIILRSQLLIDDLFPPKVKQESSVTKANKIIYNIGMMLTFGGIVAMIFVATPIGNTLHGTRFFWSSAEIGIILFIMMMIFLKLKYSSAFDESSRRYSIYFGYLIGFFLIVPATACLLNYTFSSQKIECKNYTVKRKDSGGRRSTSYYIFCEIDGSTERFEVVKSFWDLVDDNRTIQLCLKKGYFGYDYVVEFKTLNTE